MSYLTPEINVKVTFNKTEKVADNIYTFWFQTPVDFQYKAGQFIELRIPHADKDKRGERRWFTLSSSPDDSLVSITTKFANENGSSFKKALRELTATSQVYMTWPIGDFKLPEDTTIPVVLVAGGIGCTPYHSMLSAKDQKTVTQRPTTLLYNASATGEVAFKDTFKVLGNNFKTIVGERLQVKQILDAASADNSHIYLSGPDPMVKSFTKQLKEAGVATKRVHADFFPGYTKI